MKARDRDAALRVAITAELGEDPVDFSLRWRAAGHSWHAVAGYMEKQLPTHLHRMSMWQPPDIPETSRRSHPGNQSMQVNGSFGACRSVHVRFQARRCPV